MNFSVIYDQDLDCLTGKVDGNLGPENLGAYVEEIERMARKHPCQRFLNDCRNAVIKLSVIDVYDTPGLVIKENFGRRWKRALLVSEDEIDKARFFEDTANNRGVLVKIFTEEKEALDWLITPR